MNGIPIRSKFFITKSTRIYNITELVLKLSSIVNENKKIQSNLNTIHSLPIYCTYYYTVSETDDAIYDECLTFYHDDNLHLIDNVSLDKIVDWIIDNPIKVEKILKLKAFV